MWASGLLGLVVRRGRDGTTFNPHASLEIHLLHAMTGSL
jgi:hypothetical protein